jgi:microcystin degradation protein MlrC
MQAEGPICLADVASTTGAGRSGDGTEILRSLIAHNAKSAVIALMFDPETVRQPVAAGVGATIEATIGGKVDGLPVGMMFTAPLAQDALLLQLAAQLEQAQPWFDRRPPL